MRVREVSIPVNGDAIIGDFNHPEEATKLVIFAHGSGSSRFSSRNRFVAEQLNHRGIATLLIDLLTKDEERVDIVTREIRFDIDLLTDRLTKASDWASSDTDAKDLIVGYFGASTGAAAALQASVDRKVFATVSRGGRPDLTDETTLTKVTAPTLLIVGGNDGAVIGMNEAAASRLNEEYEITIVPRATHLFEESGALEEVAELAGDWFTNHS